MTVDHYAEARERAEKLLAVEAYKHEPRYDGFGTCQCGQEWSPTHLARVMLDALIAAKLSTECPTCDGVGHKLNNRGSRMYGKCPDCTDGRIEGGPLVILAGGET